jgi:hypothetical protein
MPDDTMRYEIPETDAPETAPQLGTGSCQVSGCPCESYLGNGWTCASQGPGWSCGHKWADHVN